MNLSAKIIHLSMAALIVALAIGGCGLRTPPDPNNLLTAPPDRLAKLLRQNITMTSDMLGQRVDSGEITDKERLSRLSARAQELLKYGNYATCQPQDAWIYADLLLTSKQYKTAIPVLREAVSYATAAKDDDRRVNDSLRLARALAMTGETGPALNLAQQVIDSKPHDPGPVLPSVLLELTPATAGKGHDEQLARLLEESIHEHLTMKVDPKSEAGALFLLARNHHIANAWKKIVELLKASGHPDQAAAADLRARAMMNELIGQNFKSA